MMAKRQALGVELGYLLGQPHVAAEGHSQMRYKNYCSLLNVELCLVFQKSMKLILISFGDCYWYGL